MLCLFHEGLLSAYIVARDTLPPLPGELGHEAKGVQFQSDSPAVEAQMSPGGITGGTLTLEPHDLCPACVELTRRP